MITQNPPFVAFNLGSPLHIKQHHTILRVARKGLLFFIGQDQVLAIEHIKDVASLCEMH